MVYAVMYLVIFLYGIVIGSFLNVCIYRLPKNENIATVGSHCMSCGHRLAWYDLFPLFSFLFLGGKCRYCKTKLSPQYPIVEALNGIAYMGIFAICGFEWDSILICLVFSTLLVITVIDWRTYEIPFGLNVFIFVMGIIRTALDYQNWLSHLIGMVCVSGFLFLIILATKGRGMGGGDMKLMAAAGLFTGWKEIILAFFIGCVLGSIIHICLMKFAGKGRQLAFGPYLSAGIFIAMLYGEQIISWYLGTMGF